MIKLDELSVDEDGNIYKLCGECKGFRLIFRDESKTDLGMADCPECKGRGMVKTDFGFCKLEKK